MNPWTPRLEEREPNWQKRKTSYQEAINGGKQSQTQKGRRMTSGKSYVSVVIKRGTSLAIARRSSSDHVNSVSGNHDPALARIDRPTLKKPTNKCERSAMTAHQNKEPRIGSPT